VVLRERVSEAAVEERSACYPRADSTNCVYIYIYIYIYIFLFPFLLTLLSIACICLRGIFAISLER